jgi:hypothetical protein
MWPITFKNIIIKTPLLAAEGFLILEIQILGQFMASIQWSMPFCLTRWGC